ncbi:MAG TPA: DUF1629 domain-containing protein [Cellvibrio sp.]|nr:DUF1629 domain-containing protein [Cellvibrio sp.]
MPFYIMKQDTLMEDIAYLDGLPDDMDALEWQEGKIMSPPSEKLVLNLSLDSGGNRGDIIDGFATLYSDELKEALEVNGVDNVRFYPVLLLDPNDNTTERGFWLANIIGLFDCIDMINSKVKYWASGMGFNFLSMVIDESKTNGAKIFRLKEDPTKVIINQELKDYFDKTNMLIGVTLIQTENYSDW